MSIETVAAGLERVPTLAAVLGRSFADDSIIRWPFPEDRDEDDAERRCGELSRILNERFADAGWLWGAGDAAGVGLWVPPRGGHGTSRSSARPVTRSTR